VGVVVDDDPAADLHDWYGRYLYFSPDELEPLKTEESNKNPWKEFDMDVLGWVFVVIVGIAVAAAVVMGLVSLPDARRYLKLRRM
jgi:hypothetical protein